MADCSFKNVEDIKVGDTILTYNHEQNKYTPEEVIVTYKGDNLKKAFVLIFSNGERLAIVGEHDLFEQEDCKYVTISEDTANGFIGKHFYSSLDCEYVELVAIEYSNEPVEYYDIYSAHNFNAVASGMLTLPQDVDYLLNFYEFNEDLSVKKDVLQSDIEKYGLMELKDVPDGDPEDYDNWNQRYLNVIMGKGLITYDTLVAQHNKFVATGR